MKTIFDLSRDRRGVVFVTALAMMFILMTMGTALMVMTRSEINISTNLIQSTKAFYYAEAGIEHACAEIANAIDADGDGLGSIPLIDIDGDGQDDYSVTYDSVNKIISATGTYMTVSRTIQAQINDSGITGAMMGASGILVASNTGTIEGDIIAPFIMPSPIEVTSMNGQSLEEAVADDIPTPVYADYEAVADFVYASSTTFTVSPAAGIHYVKGDLRINGDNITIDGSIVVEGMISFDAVWPEVLSSKNLTINPVDNNPAIIVANGIMANGFGSDIFEGHTYNGLIYSDNLINFDYCDDLTINGAIVSKSSNVEVKNSNNLSITFDKVIDPPNFQGGRSGKPVIISWKAH